MNQRFDGVPGEYERIFAPLSFISPQNFVDFFRRLSKKLSHSQNLDQESGFAAKA
jgi:hypothetical protein